MEELKGMVLNKNKMPTERVTNLERQLSKKEKEKAQVPNDIRVIRFLFHFWISHPQIILQWINHNAFQFIHFISLYISRLSFQGASTKDFWISQCHLPVSLKILHDNFSSVKNISNIATINKILIPHTIQSKVLLLVEGSKPMLPRLVLFWY